MIYSKREKNNASSSNIVQIIPDTSLENRLEENSNFIIELSLEEKKQEAKKPLYIKRI